jgi:hypothetical protein
LFTFTAVFNGFAETEFDKVVRERDQYLGTCDAYKTVLEEARHELRELSQKYEPFSQIPHGSQCVEALDLLNAQIEKEYRSLKFRECEDACRRIAQKQTGLWAYATGQAIQSGDFEKCSKSAIVNIWLAGHRRGGNLGKEEASKTSQPIQ